MPVEELSEKRIESKMVLIISPLTEMKKLSSKIGDIRLN